MLFTIDENFLPQKIATTSALSIPSERQVSLLSIPAEIRIKIYENLLPPNAPPADYAGLRRTSRQIRNEFDHEVPKSAEQAYDEYTNDLSKQKISVESDFIDVFNARTLHLSIPEGFFNPAHAFPPMMIPFHWPWLRTVKIKVIANHRYVTQRTFDAWADSADPLHAMINEQSTDRKSGKIVTNIRAIHFRWNIVQPNILRVRDPFMTYEIFPRWSVRHKFDTGHRLRSVWWSRKWSAMDWITAVLTMALYPPICGFILIAALAFLDLFCNFVHHFLVAFDADIASFDAAVINSAMVAATKSNLSRESLVIICDFIDNLPDLWECFLLWVQSFEQIFLWCAGEAICT